MSKALKEIREEGREEGIEDIIRNLYQSGMSVNEIAYKTKVGEPKVLKILGITDSKDFYTNSAETSFFSKNTN